ncbi:MAG: hypothetical protein IJ086_00690 [Clostridium sp.]|nr:hypothetical protein [Clostridium sp.]
MIGNLFLKFKIGKLVNNAYKLADMKEYELHLIVGIENESYIDSYLEREIYNLLSENGINLDDDESIFNLEYYFDEITEDEDIESLWLDCDFR